MKKFEYKVLKVSQEGFWDPKLNTSNIEDILNKLGFEGWELTGTVETNASHGMTKEIILFFKRESRF